MADESADNNEAWQGERTCDDLKSVLGSEDPFEQIVTEFTERCRLGENPSISEYVERHPELEEAIRDLFPTVAAMEKLKVRKEIDSSHQPLRSLPLTKLGDYRILQEVGRGGMGIVYEAEQESLGRRVAVKVLPKQSTLDSKQLRRFQREAQTAARLHHTNIVPVFGVGEHDGFHYYVMQYIQGVGIDALLDFLCNESKGDGGPSECSGAVSYVVDSLVRGEFKKKSALSSGSDIGSATPHDAVASGALTNSAATDDKNSELDTVAGFTEGTTKFDHDHPRQLGRTYWTSVARIGLQVAEALEYAHQQGTLHRDIKPANLLMDHTGAVWVADFGLARAVEQSDVSHTGDIVGTLRYMAPEQFKGEADERSDLFSLGVTLYELTSLRPAFTEGERKKSLVEKFSSEPMLPRRINPAIPRDLETIVLKCIAQDPCHRYQTASDVVADLSSFLEDRPIRARHITSAERLWRWCRRNRLVASLTVSAACLLIAVALLTTVGYFREASLRAKSEAITEISLEAFDQFYQSFVPDRILQPTEMTVDELQGEEVLISVITPETAELLNKMLVFYDRLAEQESDDERLAKDAAKANRRVGDIYQRLGQTDRAQKAYQTASDLYGSLTADSDPETRLEVAKLHNARAETLIDSGKANDAEKAHLTAVGILQELLGSSPAPEVEFELARTHYLLAKHSRPAALRPPSGGFDRGRKRSRGDRRTADRKSQMKKSFEQFQVARRNFDEKRRKHLEQATSILERIAETHAQVAHYRHLLALCHLELSAGRSIENPEVKRSFLQATSILQDLVLDYPTVSDYKHDLSNAYEGFTKRRLEPQLNRDAEAYLKTALAIRESLVRQHPSIPAYRMSLALLEQKIAFQVLGTGDFDQAEARLNQAIKHQVSLVEQFPELSRLPQFLTIRARQRLAFLHLQRGDSTKAASLLNELVDQLEQMLQSTPQNDREHNMVRHGLSNAYSELANIAAGTNDADEEARLRKLAEKYQDKDRTMGPPGGFRFGPGFFRGRGRGGSGRSI